jgi:TolB-like protein/Tfp pilus assembly protein PilF
MASFIDELKRRKVFRVGVTYLVVAWLLLQFTDLVFENLDAPGWIMRVIMLVLAIGFPLALILAWAFESTPEGMQRDEGVVSSANARWLYGMLGLALAIGLVVFVWRPEPGDESAAPTEVVDESLLAIAVLPFESFSEDRQDQYFADGLADTLLHKLAELETLTVIARNSSFQFKGRNVDVREIGESLGVPTVVEGSVQRQGNQVRVIAQLVSTDDGAHWWSGTFDGTFDNIFDLQDQIATAITEQLQITLSDRDRERLYRKGTSVPEAYEALVRADAMDIRFDAVGYDVDSDPKLALLREVVELDPDYALGWATLSDYFNALAFRDVDEHRYDEFVAELRAAAEKAIAVDPDEVAGHVALGFAHFRLSELTRAEAAFRDALALNPDHSRAMAGLGLTILPRDPAEAYRLFTRVRKLDPTDAAVHRQLLFALLSMGRHEEGIAQLEAGIRRHPDFPLLYTDLAGVHATYALRYDLAAATVARFLERQPQSRTAALAMAEYWYAVDDIARTRSWLDMIPDDQGSGMDILSARSRLAVRAGDLEQARALAESMPTDGFQIAQQATTFIAICMQMEDRDCAARKFAEVSEFMDRMMANGIRPAALYLAQRDLVQGLVSYPDAATAERVLTQMEQTLATWPILMQGGRDLKTRRYLRATALALLGRHEEALAELDMIREIPDGGFFAYDMTNQPPERSLLFAPLRETPGFEDWFREFESRRSAMREKMIAMEAAGEIMAPP